MSMTRPDASPTTRAQACREEIAGQIQAYRDLVGAASKASGMSLTRIDAALAAFEPAFFNNLLIALDARFAPGPRQADRATLPAGEALRPLDGARPRSGAREEVRALAASLLHAGGVLTTRWAEAYRADESVLKIDVGERIALNADDFESLCAAFLKETERGVA